MAGFFILCQIIDWSQGCIAEKVKSGLQFVGSEGASEMVKGQCGKRSACDEAHRDKYMMLQTLEVYRIGVAEMNGGLGNGTTSRGIRRSQGMGVSLLVGGNEPHES